jgi:hypothetical protein
MPETKVVNGEVVELTQEEISFIESERSASKREKLLRGIRLERDRRLEADFEFQGKMYQRDPVSLQRISGAATLAGFAIAAGFQVGNYRWANAARDFGWIASDDSVVLMDAQTCFAFGQAAAKVETDLIYAAKVLREMETIPEDYTEDEYWT